MKNGIIKLDSNRGREIGFTSDKYGGYLWKQGNYIMLSMIFSNGYLLNLFNAIRKKGYGIKVPTPMGRMERIVQLKGFKHTVEIDEEMGACDVWVKEYK